MNKKMSFIDNESMVDQLNSQVAASDSGGSGSGSSGSGSGSGGPSISQAHAGGETTLTLSDGFGPARVTYTLNVTAEKEYTTSGMPYFRITEAHFSISINTSKSITTQEDEEGNEIQTIYESTGASSGTDLPYRMGSGSVNTPDMEIKLIKEIRKNGVQQSSSMTPYKVHYTCSYNIKDVDGNLQVSISSVS